MTRTRPPGAHAMTLSLLTCTATAWTVSPFAKGHPLLAARTAARVKPQCIQHDAIKMQPRGTEAAQPGRPAPLNVRIEDTWYDLSLWRSAHPAGTHWIDGFNGTDATEVFEAFHSDSAVNMVARLPRSKAPPVGSAAPPDVTPLMHSFRALRKQLLAEGWWRRDWRQEARLLLPCVGLYAAGTALARTWALAATVLLALGSTASGWVAHDYVHGRGRWPRAMRGFGALMNAHSAFWWSNKHNLHHACTNQVRRR